MAKNAKNQGLDRHRFPDSIPCMESTFEGRNQDFYHPKWRIFWNRKIGNQRRRDTLILLEADRHIRVALGRCQPSCHRITPRRTRPVSAYLLRLVVASKHLGRAVGALEPFYCLMRVIVSVNRSPGDSMGALRGKLVNAISRPRRPREGLQAAGTQSGSRFPTKIARARNPRTILAVMAGAFILMASIATKHFLFSSKSLP